MPQNSQSNNSNIQPNKNPWIQPLKIPALFPFLYHGGWSQLPSRLKDVFGSDIKMTKIPQIYLKMIKNISENHSRCINLLQPIQFPQPLQLEIYKSDIAHITAFNVPKYNFFKLEKFFSSPESQIQSLILIFTDIQLLESWFHSMIPQLLWITNSAILKQFLPFSIQSTSFSPHLIMGIISVLFDAPPIVRKQWIQRMFPIFVFFAPQIAFSILICFPNQFSNCINSYLQFDRLFVTSLDQQCESMTSLISLNQADRVFPSFHSKFGQVSSLAVASEIPDSQKELDVHLSIDYKNHRFLSSRQKSKNRFKNDDFYCHHLIQQFNPVCNSQGSFLGKYLQKLASAISSSSLKINPFFQNQFFQTLKMFFEHLQSKPIIDYFLFQCVELSCRLPESFYLMKESIQVFLLALASDCVISFSKDVLSFNHSSILLANLIHKDDYVISTLDCVNQFPTCTLFLCALFPQKTQFIQQFDLVPWSIEKAYIQVCLFYGRSDLIIKSACEIFQTSFSQPKDWVIISNIDVLIPQCLDWYVENFDPEKEQQSLYFSSHYWIIALALSNIHSLCKELNPMIIKMIKKDILQLDLYQRWIFFSLTQNQSTLVRNLEHSGLLFQWVAMFYNNLLDQFEIVGHPLQCIRFPYMTRFVDGVFFLNEKLNTPKHVEFLSSLWSLQCCQRQYTIPHEFQGGKNTLFDWPEFPNPENLLSKSIHFISILHQIQFQEIQIARFKAIYSLNHPTRQMCHLTWSTAIFSILVYSVMKRLVIHSKNKRILSYFDYLCNQYPFATQIFLFNGDFIHNQHIFSSTDCPMFVTQANSIVKHIVLHPNIFYALSGFELVIHLVQNKCIQNIDFVWKAFEPLFQPKSYKKRWGNAIILGQEFFQKTLSQWFDFLNKSPNPGVYPVAFAMCQIVSRHSQFFLFPIISLCECTFAIYHLTIGKNPSVDWVTKYPLFHSFHLKSFESIFKNLPTSPIGTFYPLNKRVPIIQSLSKYTPFDFCDFVHWYVDHFCSTLFAHNFDTLRKFLVFLPTLKSHPLSTPQLISKVEKAILELFSKFSDIYGS